jgi:hypothetical protein
MKKVTNRRPAGTRRLAATAAMLAGVALLGGIANARDDDRGNRDEPRGRGASRQYCSATTDAQFKACRYEKLDDYHVARALCINISSRDARGDCFEDARVELAEGRSLCGEQRVQRLEICDELGEARYDRDFDPADFETDYHHLANPHPYFPLTIGYRWDYSGTLETNTITALDETKLIQGVTCIVLNDKRYEDGLLAEDTDDWYGQRTDGTVEFCGEAVSNFETFPGDVPLRPERVSTDGQWKTGRDGIPSGAYILASPKVGEAHRSEFAPGLAEDTVRYLSLSYGYGSDRALDENVPQALIETFCSNHDCWVSGENTGLEPGEFTRKYYARGVGFILGIDEETGDSVQLIDCNFDARCASLPVP